MGKESGGGEATAGLKGHSVYGEKERLRDIDVRREERDEERQLGMERRPLALNRERDDEAKKGQKR